MAQLHSKKLFGKKGFSLVEVLLAIAIFVMTASALTYMIVDTSIAHRQGKDRSVAAALAEEGQAAARNIRDSGWANLTVGTHGLIQANGQWEFYGSSDIDPTNRFTRRIVVSEISPSKRLISVNIDWNFTDWRAGNVNISSYLTDWSRIIPPVPPDWDEPEIIGTVSTNNVAGNRNPNDIYKLGNYVYLVTDEANAVDPELFVFDVSNPSAPLIVGEGKVGSKVSGVYAAGNYAYIATDVNDGEVQIFRVTDPTNPILVSKINTPGNANAADVFVVDNFAYIVTDNNSGGEEFYVYDVLDPEHPAAIPSSKLELGTHARSVFVSGNIAYIGTDDDTKEIQLINCENKSSIRVAKTYNNPGIAIVNDINISGNKVYFVTDENGGNPNVVILTVDSTDLNNIQISTTMNFHNTDNNVGVWADPTNNQIFLATKVSLQEFAILDVLNPAAPVIKSSIDMPGQAVAIAYDGTYSYLASITNSQELIIVGPKSTP